MKIAIVHSYYTDAEPSGENFTVDMQVDALTQAGHEVRVVSARTDDLSDRPFYRSRTAVNVATGHGKSPLHELQEFGPDIVHVHNLFPNYATNWLRQWPGSVVATLHNFRPLCSNGIMFRDGSPCALCPERGHHHAVVHKCYRNSRLATAPVAFSNRGGVAANPILSRSQRLIVLSERSRATYTQHGVDPERLIVIPNFIDDTSEPFDPPGAHGAWMYAGRLSVEKGILDLLEKWPDEEQLTVVGSGPEAEAVKAIAGSRRNITFLGHVARDWLLDEMPKYRGVVMPSLCAENLPTVYLEALSAGKPVIARTGNSAADDILTWDESLTYSDGEGLHRALRHARQAGEALGFVARDHFSAHYTRKAWLAAIESLYLSPR
ncbi:glycosyltransferase family 4 protein [Kocuria rosea]|uniref:glycosyltransferase family 4 protein n=1 Tax=Kocuria rosea TaxID=1275 RepID=UPI001558FF36|nr:glycosyltransferase family 4 protein [Kocuria rosea]